MNESSAQQNAGFSLLLVAVSLLLAGLVGCSEEVRGPQQVFDAYLDALGRGEQQAALDEVWPPTRSELQAAHDELATHFDGEPPVEPSQLLVVTGVANPMSISRTTVDGGVPENPEDGQTVTLNLEFRDTRSASVPVRWSSDDGRWYVDVPVQNRRSLEISAPDSGSGESGADGGQEASVDESSGAPQEVNDQ